MEKYEMRNPFTVCFTSMKIRYQEYDKSIDDLAFVKPEDKINVFINFESVLNNLSMIKDLENKLLLERKFPVILESEILNLCAHYKKFFRGNGLETRVFLYYTDLTSTYFDNFKYNDEYRCFYLNKYMNNPRYQLLGNTLVGKIFPTVKRISEYIPKVYIINGKDIEGSMIPYVIAESDPTYKNFIVSTDKYETSYYLKHNFCLHYIKKSPMGSAIYCTFQKYLSDMFKENLLDDHPDIELYSNPSYFTALNAAFGDKVRSLDPLKGVGSKTTTKIITSGIERGDITKSTGNIELIKNAFPEEHQERLINNFYCMNLEQQYKAMDEKKRFDILSQITDRFDYNSLLLLNRTEYVEYPLMLPELTS